jgi:hypothetical protein
MSPSSAITAIIRTRHAASRRSASADWKYAETCASLVDRHQRAGFEHARVRRQNFNGQSSDGGGQYILRPYLKHARTLSSGESKKRPEIEIVSEHNVRVVSSILHDRFIGCARIADCRPMDGLDSVPCECVYPSRG